MPEKDDEMQICINQESILKRAILRSVTQRAVESRRARDNWANRQRQFRMAFLLIVGIFVTLVGCAGPMNDTAGKSIHEA